MRTLGAVVPLLRFVEPLDEAVFGARAAARPAVRDDLGLSYAEIGPLLGFPMVPANFVEMPSTSWLVALGPLAVTAGTWRQNTQDAE